MAGYVERTGEIGAVENERALKVVGAMLEVGSKFPFPRDVTRWNSASGRIIHDNLGSLVSNSPRGEAVLLAFNSIAKAESSVSRQQALDCEQSEALARAEGEGIKIIGLVDEDPEDVYEAQRELLIARFPIWTVDRSFSRDTGTHLGNNSGYENQLQAAMWAMNRGGIVLSVYAYDQGKIEERPNLNTGIDALLAVRDHWAPDDISSR